MSNWHNVSKSEPCPICHKTDWCNLSNDGAVAICHRVESPYPARSGSGWIHALRANDERRMMNDERSRRRIPLSLTTNSQQLTTTIDFSRVHAAYDADPILIEGLATTLGVDDQPLKAMDVRFNRMDECWSFPMRDADGKIVGLRFRELGGSKKWSARGGHDGLFYAPCSVDAVSSLRENESTTVDLDLRPRPSELFIVEGPSDTAALLSLFKQSNNSPAVVGRSSCQTGGPLLRQYIRRIRPRYVTIVADNDAPGIRGADLLVSQLKQSNNPNNQTTHPPMRVLVVPSPYKDIRAWYLSGKLTPKLFTDMVSAQKWR